MKPKYKIGDRVVHKTKLVGGKIVEGLSEIDEIHISITKDQTTIDYADKSEFLFPEKDILHKLAIVKPRKSKANKIVEEMKEFKAPKPPGSLADLIVDALEQEKE